MNRKRTGLGLVGAVILIVATLGLSLKHEPAFYKAALSDKAPVEERREQATRFEQTTLQLVNEIRFEDRWSHEISDDMVNAWLAEDLPVKFGDSLPPNVSAPRVKFEKGRLLLAFQAQRGAWRGVVSSRIRPWVAGPNQLALEIESTRIGLIPVPVEEIVGDLVKKLANSGWRLEWKTSGKRDVLVVSFDSDDISSEGERAVLESVELEPKLLRISGRRSTESAALSRAGSETGTR
ncbi:MAG: hypothetical protein HY290_12640 [Planctomycetia bacterium]|nr:hypothetical protein [Planctomycetia bacterium]